MSGYMIQSRVAGALAGIAATATMTLVMGILHRRLPRRDRYPLPPREITSRIAQAAGVHAHMDERQRVDATLASHFAFGAAAGALYPWFAGRTALPPVASGVAYGLAVWTASYLGWIPLARILNPATEHPARRNLLMIIAHIAWGGTTGVVASDLERAGRTFLAAGPARDAPAVKAFSAGTGARAPRAA